MISVIAFITYEASWQDVWVSEEETHCLSYYHRCHPRASFFDASRLIPRLLFKSQLISLSSKKKKKIIGIYIIYEPVWILLGKMNPNLQHRESILLLAFSIEPWVSFLKVWSGSSKFSQKRKGGVGMRRDENKIKKLTSLSFESNWACISFFSVTSPSFAILCRSNARRSLFDSSFSFCKLNLALLSLSLEIVIWCCMSTSWSFKASFRFWNSEHRSAKGTTRSLRSSTASSSTL